MPPWNGTLTSTISNRENGKRKEDNVGTTKEVTFVEIGKLAPPIRAHLHGIVDFQMVISDLEKVSKVTYAMKRELETTYGEDKTAKDMITYWYRDMIGTVSHIKELIEDTMRTFDLVPPGERQKRDIIGWIMAGTAIGISAYNTVQITQLFKELNDVQEAQKHIAAALVDENKVVTANSMAIQALKGTLLFEATLLKETKDQMRLLRVLGAATSQLHRYEMEITTWLNAITTMVTTKKLTPGIVSPKTVSKALEKVTREAAKRGLKPLEPTLHSLYQASVSYKVDQSRLYFAAHWILVGVHPMTLFRLKPLPTPLGKNLVVELNHDKTILALDETQSFGIEMTEEELSRCEKIKDDMICEERPMTKHPGKTCLGSLFLGDTEATREMCPFTVVRPKIEIASRSSRNELSVYSPESATWTETCKSESIMTIVAPGLTKLRLKPGCRWTSKDSVFQATADLDLDEVLERKDIKVPQFDQLLTASRHGIEEIEETIASLESIGKTTPVDLTDVIQIAERTKSDGWKHSSHIASTSLVTILFLGIFGIIGWILWKKSRKVWGKNRESRKNRKMESMSQTLKTLAEVLPLSRRRATSCPPTPTNLEEIHWGKLPEPTPLRFTSNIPQETYRRAQSLASYPRVLHTNARQETTRPIELMWTPGSLQSLEI